MFQRGLLLLVFISLVDLFLYLELAQGRRNRGVQGGAAAAPPDFENPEKLSHKNAIKLEFFEKWGKIVLLAPPDFRSSRRPCICLKLAKTVPI